MFEWLCNILANAAYDAAIHSADVASHSGLYQMEEPEALQKIAKERKK